MSIMRVYRAYWLMESGQTIRAIVVTCDKSPLKEFGRWKRRGFTVCLEVERQLVEIAPYSLAIVLLNGGNELLLCLQRELFALSRFLLADLLDLILDLPRGWQNMKDILRVLSAGRDDNSRGLGAILSMHRERHQRGIIMIGLGMTEIHQEWYSTTAITVEALETLVDPFHRVPGERGVPRPYLLDWQRPIQHGRSRGKIRHNLFITGRTKVDILLTIIAPQDRLADNLDCSRPGTFFPDLLGFHFSLASMAPGSWPKIHVRCRVALLRADRVPAVAILCNRVDLLSQGRGKRGLGKHGVEADGLTAIPQSIQIFIP